MKKETALSGSVQEKNGKLYAVIGHGDPITKKRKYKWIGLNITPDAKKSVVKAALRDAIAAFTEQYEKECRGILSPEDCPFLEFLQSWLVNVKKPNVQKSTYDGYEELIERRIRAFFGDKLTLKDITPVRIQEFYASIRADGCKEKTVLEYHNLLHDACGWAVRQEILLSNPFDKVDRPKPKKYSACYYTPEQVQLLMEAAKGERLFLPVILAAYYGLRRSEVVGLRWSNIDFENKRIYIRNKASEVKENGKLQTVITDEMKTESSKRALPLLPEVENILREHRELQDTYRRLYRRDYAKEYLDMVCVNPLGNLIRPNYISERFPKMLKKNGLPRIRFHDLRHSCASMLIAHKAGMKQVQMWMGHSSITTTMDTYGHLDDSAKVELGETMASLLGKNKTEEKENGSRDHHQGTTL